MHPSAPRFRARIARLYRAREVGAEVARASEARQSRGRRRSRRWGEQRGLNPRPPGPQPGALPAELCPPCPRPAVRPIMATQTILLHPASPSRHGRRPASRRDARGTASRPTGRRDIVSETGRRDISGATGPRPPGATRTRNRRIRRPMLYPLSYGGPRTGYYASRTGFEPQSAMLDPTRSAGPYARRPDPSAGASAAAAPASVPTATAAPTPTASPAPAAAASVSASACSSGSHAADTSPAIS